ncbi:MAG: AbrB/MazE/SpoVT family DNA-binding domain-containing protein [Novosphingobium sp.]|jgi:AbrB family looped-hinge helix DNA binding protein|nr:AbrB/MazE/SpoVT family DNA-binding domain-containing protein [Novosphingobium sp.]
MNAPVRIETGTMTSKGQILIPKAIREAAGLVPGQPYKVLLDDKGCVIVAPLADGPEDVARRQQAQARAIEAIAGRFAFGAPTDDVMRELRGDCLP